ncbi:MAG: hypothetical protein ACK53L_27275, partial [Pirellulaceae bacterium]
MLNRRRGLCSRGLVWLACVVGVPTVSPLGRVGADMPAAKVSVASPVSPQESLRWLRVDENYEVSLVASEPQVVDPVAIQFDDQGRIWVAEYGDYPNGPA